MKTYLPRVGLLLLLAVGVVLAWLNRGALTDEALSAQLGGLGSWAWLMFLGIYCVAPALFLPGSVLTLAGGALFGPIPGALLSLLGSTVGGTVAFLIGRYLAADWVEHRASGRMREIKEGVEREGWRFVAFVRLVPVFPFNFLNYVLGLTRLSVRTFALTSFIAMAPGALAYAYMGYAGREAISGGPDLVRKVFLAFTLLAAASLLHSLIRRWRRPRMIQPQRLQELLSQEEPPLILDVRGPEEFEGESGHIRGSVLMPLPELGSRLSELAPYRTRTIVTV